MTQIEVLVKSKETGENRVLTYRSYLDTSQYFDLIGQCDSEGNLIEGDPNLNPRYQRTKARASVVVHAADSGVQDFTKVQEQWKEASKPVVPEVVKPDVPREKRKYTKKQPA